MDFWVLKTPSYGDFFRARLRRAHMDYSLPAEAPYEDFSGKGGLFGTLHMDFLVLKNPSYADFFLGPACGGPVWTFCLPQTPIWRFPGDTPRPPRGGQGGMLQLFVLNYPL